MPIQKPDFSQIFASQAPDIDKPPVFNNYNGGWGDESRPNNGKPTIKGFNYLQQQTDNKFLWMMQNGAFPYDSSIDYAVGVVTVKDGRFKQWNGTTWVNFGQDDGALKSTNNLSDLPNKPIARTNLDVYSTTQVNAAIAAAIPPGTPNATETTAGKAKIATTAIAQAGTNDTDFITAKKLQQKLDASIFGVGQSWVDVTATRLASTAYVNTSIKTITVAIRALQGNRDIQVSADGVNWLDLGRTGSDGDSETVVFPVPPNWQTRINGLSTGFVWMEMK